MHFLNSLEGRSIIFSGTLLYRTQSPFFLFWLYFRKVWQVCIHNVWCKNEYQSLGRSQLNSYERVIYFRKRLYFVNIFGVDTEHVDYTWSFHKLFAVAHNTVKICKANYSARIYICWLSYFSDNIGLRQLNLILLLFYMVIPLKSRVHYKAYKFCTAYEYLFIKIFVWHREITDKFNKL